MTSLFRPQYIGTGKIPVRDKVFLFFLNQLYDTHVKRDGGFYFGTRILNSASMVHIKALLQESCSRWTRKPESVDGLGFYRV